MSIFDLYKNLNFDGGVSLQSAGLQIGLQNAQTITLPSANAGYTYTIYDKNSSMVYVTMVAGQWQPQIWQGYQATEESEEKPITPMDVIDKPGLRMIEI